MEKTSIALLLGLACACANSNSSTEHAGLRVHAMMRDYSNVYLVGSPGKWVMIDAGNPDDAEVLEEGLAELGIDPKNIAALIVTHAHGDHLGTAAHFRSVHGIDVYLGEGDRELLAAGGADELCPVGFVARQRVDDDREIRYEPVEPTHWVSAPTDLQSTVGLPVELAMLPGHTPGSMVVLVGDAVFVGDLFRGSIVGSAAETHFYMCDLEDNVADMRRLLTEIAPDAQWFYPGHFDRVSREQLQDLVDDMAADLGG